MDYSSSEGSPVETVSPPMDEPQTPEKEVKPKGSNKKAEGPGAGRVEGGGAAAKAGPSTFSLIKEALGLSEDRRGLSYYGIRNYIAVRYPEVAARNGFVYHTKMALQKGLESGVFKRPKKDAELTKLSVGRFKLVAEKVKKPKKTAPKETGKKARGRSTSPKKKPAVRKVKPAARSLSADGAKATTATKKALAKAAGRSPSADRGKSPKSAGGATKNTRGAKSAAKPRPLSKTLAGARGKVGKAAPASKPAAKRAKSSSPALPKRLRAPQKATVGGEGASQAKPKPPSAKPKASKVKPKVSEN